MYAFISIINIHSKSSKNNIAEIAVIITNENNEQLKEYHTLLNPGIPVTWYITQATGITQHMVWDQVEFYSIAHKINELTEGCTIVASSATTYRTLQMAMQNSGISFQRNYISTASLMSHNFPSWPRYDLPSQCRPFNINIKSPHRALHLAQATQQLFQKINQYCPGIAQNFIVADQAKEVSLPPALKPQAFHSIPSGITGVYYFHNNHQQVLYVGKSLDIKKRLTQHFNSNGKSKHMLQEVTDISYQDTGNELTALLLESSEIKTLNPIHNVSQKITRNVSSHGIFSKTDRQGYINLYIKKVTANQEPLLLVSNASEATTVITAAIDKFKLCVNKCNSKQKGPCHNFILNKCNGACNKSENKNEYNNRVKKAIASFTFHNQSFFLLAAGRKATEKAVVCIEAGIYKGFGFIDYTFGSPSLDELRDCIKHYPHNKNIQQILHGQYKNDYTKISYDPLVYY